MARSLPAPAIAETLFPAIDDEIRLAALDRLYTRRETVDELIRSLELYELEKRSQSPGRRLAPCIPINVSPKWS